MAIDMLSKDEFAQTLHVHLSPSKPIQSFEHLKGREIQLNSVEQALYSPGRHIFIYGDRGVGKTSLAQTAAFRHQSSDNEPILVSCERKSSFCRTMENIAAKLTGDPTIAKRIVTRKTGVSIRGVSHEVQEQLEKGLTPSIRDVNTAINLLRYLLSQHSQKTVVVVDEFDLVRDSDDQAQFTDFIKQLGDQNIKAQFIFCGIGKSLDDLLSAHASCYRYLEAIELTRLDWSARWEIIDECAKSLGVKVNDDSRFRVAAISDGFPHYIHLVAEKLFWEVFNDPQRCRIATTEHYQAAVSSAVRSIQLQLKKAYDKATMKDTDDFQEVLWAVADHFELVRHKDAIYRSYQRIMNVREKHPLDLKTFATRLTQLRSPTCGRILLSVNRNWCSFSENIVRGYVRLRAEDAGVPLAVEHEPSNEPKRLTVGEVKLRPVSSMPRPTFGRTRKW